MKDINLYVIGRAIHGVLPLRVISVRNFQWLPVAGVQAACGQFWPKMRRLKRCPLTMVLQRYRLPEIP